MSDEADRAPHTRTRTRRRALLVGLAASALGLWLWLGRREQRAVRALLAQLAAACTSRPGETSSAWRARLRAELEQLLAPDARLTIHEGPELRGRSELLARAEQFAGERERWFVEVEGAEVFVDGAHARVVASVALSGVQLDDLHRDLRHLDLECERSPDDGRWRLVRAHVGPSDRLEPEERP